MIKLNFSSWRFSNNRFCIFLLDDHLVPKPLKIALETLKSYHGWNMALFFDLNIVNFFWLQFHFFHLLELEIDVAHALCKVFEMESVTPFLVLYSLPGILLLDYISRHLLGTSCFLFPLAPFLVCFLTFCNHILKSSNAFFLSYDIFYIHDLVGVGK